MAADLVTGAREAVPRPLGRMPVAIPADVGDRTLPKARGVARLPGHVAWSPPFVYDLDDRTQRCRAYARVMSEGLEADVRYFVDVDELVDVWDEIHIPPHVRERRQAWLTEHGRLA